jgi:hypothetical protein
VLHREGEIEMPPPAAATVVDFDVPLAKLAMFFVRAVFAAIPALLILMAVLWVFGHTLQIFFPQLLKMKIDVQIYSPQSAADFRAQKDDPDVTMQARLPRK